MLLLRDTIKVKNMIKVDITGAGLVALIVSICMHVLAIFSFALRFYRRQRQMSTSRRDYSIFYKKKSDLFMVIAVVRSISSLFLSK